LPKINSTCKDSLLSAVWDTDELQMMSSSDTFLHFTVQALYI